MLNKPMRQKAAKFRQQAVTRSIPAPIGGWNARDPEAKMPPTDALELTNWWPETADISFRKGCETSATSVPAPVETLMAYNGTLTSQLFAATRAGIFDVSVAGAVNPAVTSCTNGRFSYTNYNTLGGSYLYAVNGVNKAKLYNGTVWKDIDGTSTPAITNIATTSLTYLAIFKRRLWFIEKNSMSAWYLPVDQIGGAAVEFPVGQLFSKGGYLLAMGNWTLDGGNGLDDHLVMLTSNGEVAVYKGTDPSSSTTFALIGVYFIGKPVGFSPLVSFGGDLLILIDSGLYPLSKALLSATINRASAITYKIQDAIAAATAQFSSRYGWSIIPFPKQNALILNIPTVVTGEYAQYIMNTITGAWTKFTGWNGICFELYKNQLYFGGKTFTAKAWSGTQDLGENITATALQAFNYFGVYGQQKRWNMLRPTIKIDGDITVCLALAVDFDRNLNYSCFNLKTPRGAKWDIAVWDADSWGDSSIVTKDWRTAFAKEGYCAGIALTITNGQANINWPSTDILFEAGGVL